MYQQLPAKIDLLVEEEEIDDGYHDLDDGDEGCRENWTPLLDTPGHYQEAHCRRKDALIPYATKYYIYAMLYLKQISQVDYITLKDSLHNPCQIHFFTSSFPEL